MTYGSAGDEAALDDEANASLSELLEEINSESGMRPRCFQGASIGYAKTVTLGGRLDCKTCAFKTTCSVADPRALIDRSGKPPCFGSAPHWLSSGVACAYEKCGVSTECQALHDQLYNLHAVKLIDDARRKASEYLLGQPIPSPVIPPAGAEISVAEGAGEPCVLKTETAVAAKASVSRVSKKSSALETKVGTAKPSLFDVSAVNIQQEVLIKESDAVLLEAVECLSHGKLSSDDKERREYSAVRERFLAASFLLNERGTYAPRFRERKSLDYKMVPSDQLYACDLQIVDLHWLSIHGSPLPLAEWKGLFSHAGLNVVRAWDFACHKVKSGSKVMLLALGGVEEHCLSVIRREEVRQTWLNLHRQRDRVIRDIKIGIAKSGGRMKSQPELLFHTYMAVCATEGEVSLAREVFCYMGHGAPTSTVFGRRVKWLQKAGLLPAACSAHVA